jgi:PAS domain S-box-containing protein
MVKRVGGTPLPAFVVEQRAALLDLWTVYDGLIQQVQDGVVEAALREPEWAAVMPLPTIAQIVDYACRSRQMLRTAVLEGDWQPYIDHTRSLGVRYAELGAKFSSWYSLGRLILRRVTPALIAAYAADPPRLAAARSAAAELLEFSIGLIAEQFVETAQHDRFRMLVDSVKDYAIYMLDADGVVTSWNAGAQMITGYSAAEALGQRDAMLFLAADREDGAPARALATAAAVGRCEEAGTRVRRDGSQFWAEVVVTAIRAGNALVGFASVIRDLTDRKRIEATLEHRTHQLEDSNRDLEAFSYSVAHDLRAPLRGMSGFAQILLEDYAAQLAPEAVGYLNKIKSNAARMAGLIDALLGLSKLSRGSLQLQPVDLSALARQVVAQLTAAEPQRVVEVVIDSGLRVKADAALLRTVLENLIGNAWKFTSQTAGARIAIGSIDARTFYVRDNGAGFDMEHAGKLFLPFERIHTADQFPGTGIGLATVKRIVHRHGGRIWVTAQLGAGATFYFTLAALEP